jgi:hypothetical protein
MAISTFVKITCVFLFCAILLCVASIPFVVSYHHYAALRYLRPMLLKWTEWNGTAIVNKQSTVFRNELPGMDFNIGYNHTDALFPRYYFIRTVKVKIVDAATFVQSDAPLRRLTDKLIHYDTQSKLSKKNLKSVGHDWGVIIKHDTIKHYVLPSFVTQDAITEFNHGIANFVVNNPSEIIISMHIMFVIIVLYSSCVYYLNGKTRVFEMGIPRNKHVRSGQKIIFSRCFDVPFNWEWDAPGPGATVNKCSAKYVLDSRKLDVRLPLAPNAVADVRLYLITDEDVIFAVENDGLDKAIAMVRDAVEGATNDTDSRPLVAVKLDDKAIHAASGFRATAATITRFAQAPAAQ